MSELKISDSRKYIGRYQEKDRIPVKKSRSDFNLILIIMKTLFFKNMIPAAVIAIGISGAFVTTSMQSVSESSAFRVAYILNEDEECEQVDVPCNATEGTICKHSASNQTAFDKNAAGNCEVNLYKQN